MKTIKNDDSAPIRPSPHNKLLLHCANLMKKLNIQDNFEYFFTPTYVQKRTYPVQKLPQGITMYHGYNF